MWPAAAARSINYGLSPEMGGMLGLRDLFVVAAPSSSFHHHHHHHHHDPSAVADPANQAATTLGVGVIPLLTATPPCIENELMTTNRSGGGGGVGRGIQLWQQEQDSDEQGQYLKKQGSATATTTTAPMFELNEDFVQNENSLSVSGGGGTTTCQDCGNQAKKDCSYRRCRTCCKSRNYDCPTHVRSTWVPEARRRERRLMAASAGGGGSSGATSGGSKKPRLVTSHQQQQTATTSHTSTSNTTPPRSFDTSSSHQDAGFKEHLPGQVRAPAVFKCVRVTAVDDGQDEIAYQAVVKIGGHVFKGFLYDQGVESGRDHVYPNLSELHLGGGTGSSGGGGDGRNGASSSSPMLDPSDVYAGGGGLLGGSSYGNPIN